MPGHSAYLVWQVIRNRVIQKIIPSLGRKSNAQRNFSIALIIVSILATVLFGIYIDGYGIHPPKQYTGICATPYHIGNGGRSCTQTIEQTITQGSTTKTTQIQVPAGIILTGNSTTTVTKTVTK